MPNQPHQCHHHARNGGNTHKQHPPIPGRAHYALYTQGRETKDRPSPRSFPSLHDCYLSILHHISTIYNWAPSTHYISTATTPSWKSNSSITTVPLDFFEAVTDYDYYGQTILPPSCFLFLPVPTLKHHQHWTCAHEKPHHKHKRKNKQGKQKMNIQPRFDGFAWAIGDGSDGSAKGGPSSTTDQLPRKRFNRVCKVGTIRPQLPYQAREQGHVLPILALSISHTPPALSTAPTLTPPTPHPRPSSLP